MPEETNDFAATAAITVWEDDPASDTTTVAPLPDLARQPFGYLFDTPAPPPSDQTGSAAFRYWTAAEALRRGADFWAPQVPAQCWQRGTILEVFLDRRENLQAEYDRRSLNFYHWTLPTETIYTGASPDSLCHELGHAILDAIKPELWDRGVPEISAFHESFGDMSAILSALQVPSLRASLLGTTGSQLYCNSRLSRVAEQFGETLHAEDAQLADPDCLRNAWNGFTYCDPTSLPPAALTTHLSSRPHSFSRIFTGALFEALCAFLAHHAADSSAPTPDELCDVSKQMRDIMAKGVLHSEVVIGYFAEVAYRMVLESASIDPAYPAILQDIFVRRLILSDETAVAIRSLQTEARAVEPDEPPSEPVTVAVPASSYGLGEPLLVETGAQTQRFLARSGTPGGKSVEPAGPEVAAAAFVAELFANGQVDPGEHDIKISKDAGRPEDRTHMIIRDVKGLWLRRRLFQCGSCGGACSGPHTELTP
ncbi:hypothetical protein LJR255_004731 [Pararhizobium sp. LjRoot255]|uniref:hypothetical protein n=1 Tax=Pararhizobium sp. LjRoot255 TaxID=3342298 RepID=UPI003ECCE36E